MMRHGRTMLAVAALASVLPWICPCDVEAQVIRGWVRRADRVPVPDAVVRVRGVAGDVLAQATAGTDGSFELRPMAVGPMRLEAAHLGFADWETAEFDLSAEAAVEVLITLQFEPILLDEVSVRARRRASTRRLADFERRMEVRAFGGYFLVDEDIARRPASRPSNLVLGAPGMTVRGGAGPFDLYTIYSGDCPANVFVDGTRINQVAVSVDEYLDLERIAGVEVYSRAMSAPPQYQDAARPECGTVLYWTKDLEPDRSGGWTATKIILGTATMAGLLILSLTR